MKVFIQNEAGSSVKRCHNEKTLEFLRTAPVSRPYPFPYGFVLHTTAPDGWNVDCLILTKRAGEFHGPEAAVAYLESHRDRGLPAVVSRTG